MAIETVQWFYDKTPDGGVNSIYISSPYSPELIEAIRGQKGNKGGGIPRCQKRFNDEKYWVLSPLGSPEFTPDALDTIQKALTKIKIGYEEKILPFIKKPSTWRFRSKNLGLAANFTGTCDFYGLRHSYYNGEWLSCENLDGLPVTVPFSLWVWTPPGKQRALRLSPSGIGTFDQCQYRWFLNYVIGLKEPNKLRQHIGSAAHQGCEYLHNLLLTDTNLEWVHLVEAEHFAEAALMDPKEIAKLETPTEAAEVALSMSAVQRMLRAYFRYLITNPIQILGAEENFTVPTHLFITNPETQETLPVFLAGRADLRYSDNAGTDVVSDVKTSLKALPSPTSKVAATFDQATTYCLLSHFTSNRATNTAEIREVHPFEGVRKTTIRLEGQLNHIRTRLQRKVQAIVDAINTGRFERKLNYSCDFCPMLEHCSLGANFGIESQPPTNAVL